MPALKAEDTNLVHHAVSPATRQHYWREIYEFEAWASKHDMDLHSDDEAAHAMGRYFSELAADGESLQTGRHCLYGYMLFRRTRLWRDPKAFGEARAALRGWTRRCPTGVRDPAPVEVAFQIASFLVDSDPLMALAICVQVDTYSRPSELLAVLKEDVLQPQPRAGRSYARRWGLTLAPSTRRATTKTGQQDESLEVGILDRKFVAQALAVRWARARRGDRLFPFTLAQYERGVSSAVKALQLGKLKIVPHSFRHTGPSTDAWTGTLDDHAIQMRGRWASVLSAKRYRKHAMLLRQLRRLTPGQQTAARRALASLPAKLLKALKAHEQPRTAST